MSDAPTRDKRESLHSFVVTALLFASTLISGIMSRGFGLSLACMIDPAMVLNNSNIDHRMEKAHFNKSIFDPHYICGLGATNVSEEFHETYHGTYKWDPGMQANLISSFSWGGMGILLFAGFLVTAENCTKFLAVCMFLTGTGMALFPILTEVGGFWVAVLLRIGLGACHVLLSTSTDQTIAMEASPDWKAVIYSVVTIGSYLSAMISNSIGGYLCSVKFLGGWPAIFYLTGISVIPWLFLWFAFIIRHKKKQSHLSEQSSKRDYTFESKKRNRRLNKFQISLKSLKSTRLRNFWIEVGKTPALWALMPCVWAATWITNLLMNYIPSFYRDILRLPLNQNGIYSALPFLAISIGSLTFSTLSDLLKKLRFQVSNQACVRVLAPNFISKFLNTFGFLSSGILIAMSTLIPCMDPRNAIALLILGAGCYTASHPGYRVNIVTLAPKWTSLISVLANIVGELSSITFPYMESWVVWHGYFSEWRTLFLIIVSVDALAALIYILFGAVSLPPLKANKEDLENHELPVLLQDGENLLQKELVTD